MEEDILNKIRDYLNRPTIDDEYINLMTDTANEQAVDIVLRELWGNMDVNTKTI